MALLNGSRALTIGNLSLIGGNLSLHDYNPTPYVDLVRAGRGYYQPGQYSGAEVSYDSSGSPAEATRFVVCDARTQGTEYLLGTYKLSYSSEASLKLNSAVGCSLANVVQSGGLTTADLVVTAAPQIILDLGGAAPDFQIIAPGYSEVSPPLLTTEATDYFKRFNCLRFMDAAGINNSAQTNWASRIPSTKKHGDVKNWESLIEFANFLYAADGSSFMAVWICVPHQSDETYWTNLATLLRDNLHSAIKVYIEYSNEVWNFQFTQASWVRSQANTEVSGYVGLGDLNYDGSADQYVWYVRLWGRKVRELESVFRAVFGGPAMLSRVRPVLAGQFANTSWTSSQLTYFASQYPGEDVSDWLYAVSAAPYPQGSQAEMDSPADAAGMLAGLRSGWELSLDDCVTLFGSWRTIATNAGLNATMAYEWGPHTHFSSNQAVKYAAHIDTGMGDLITDLAVAGLSRGWGLMCYYNLSPGTFLNNGVNSLWPASQGFDGTDVKYQALVDLMATKMPAQV